MADDAHDDGVNSEIPTVGDADAAANPRAVPVPNRLGHYQIKRLIGSGGMGAVYLALQDHPRRTVALKVLKLGIASPSALRRFEYESQILGRMHHPSIATVYEAGTTDNGLPFFAMEPVVYDFAINDRGTWLPGGN